VYKNQAVRHQWLTPVILATQEAEIRRIAVRRQPWQTVHETLSQKSFIQKKRAGGVAQGVGPEFKPQYRKEPKNPTQNRSGLATQVVECLRSEHEALSSNLGMAKKIKIKNINDSALKEIRKYRLGTEIQVPLRDTLHHERRDMYF
jgi:hypothetical protein